MVRSLTKGEGRRSWLEIGESQEPENDDLGVITYTL
jgi:hypothetical protein